MDSTNTSTTSYYGVGLGLAAYFMWGFAPLYFKAMDFIDANDIVAHRIIWSVLLTLILLHKPQTLLKIVKHSRIFICLVASSLLISFNWLLFIWAIQNNHLLESSLGYFINPLITLALSMLFLQERFRPLQWLAIVLAAFAIVVPLWHFGNTPWIALGLAISFACYGLIRKKINVPALPGLCIETIVALPLAGYLLLSSNDSTAHLWNNSFETNLSLAAAGVVTMLPLLCYSAAAIRIKLSTLGMMQYIGPSIMFVLAIFGFGEALSKQQLVSFAFVWVALLIYLIDAIKQRAHTAPSNHNN